jgi:hypothetical protein
MLLGADLHCEVSLSYCVVHPNNLKARKSECGKRWTQQALHEDDISCAVRHGWTQGNMTRVVVTSAARACQWNAHLAKAALAQRFSVLYLIALLEHVAAPEGTQRLRVQVGWAGVTVRMAATSEGSRGGGEGGEYAARALHLMI